MNNYFVGAVIYADDITLLGPSRSSVRSLLNVCTVYAKKYDILFNPTKTTCMYFSKKAQYNPGPMLSFFNDEIKYVSSIECLDVTISNSDVTDRNIQRSTQGFYRKANEALSDFKIATRDVKSKLLSIHCMDAYGSQLWPFYDKSVLKYYVAWRKTIRKLWRLPYKTHCRFLHTINDCLPIDVLLEKRCLKFIVSCLQTSNKIVSSITLSSIKHEYSVIGENYRYLSYKYNILPNDWSNEFTIILKNFFSSVERIYANYPEAIFIRDICMQIDNDELEILSAEEMSQLVEYLCTI